MIELATKNNFVLKNPVEDNTANERASTYQVDPAPWFAGVWLSTSFRLRFESWPSEAGSFFFSGSLGWQRRQRRAQTFSFYPTTELRFLPPTQLSIFFVEGV